MRKTSSAAGKSRMAQSVKKTFPLHVVVDFPWDSSACMGTGAYSETAVRALAQAAPDTALTLIVGKDSPRSIELPNVRYVSLPDVRLKEEGARQVALPSFLASSKADCLFAPATLVPLAKVCPTVAVVHDLAYVRHPEIYYPALTAHLNRWLDPSLRAADRLIAISESAKHDLVDLRNIPAERISVIEQPVRQTFAERMKPSEVVNHLR